MLNQKMQMVKQQEPRNNAVPAVFLQSQKKPMRLSKHRSDDDEAAVDGEDLAGDEGRVS